MSTTKTSLLLAGCQATDFVVRVVGRGTLQESPALRGFGEVCLRRPAARLFVDLARCDYLDSTFLGTLVALYRLAPNGKRFSIIADRATRRRLLASCRLDRVLPCVAQGPDVSEVEFEQLDGNTLDNRQLGHHVMDAHRHLGEVGGPDSGAFARIADRLAGELELGEAPGRSV